MEQYPRDQKKNFLERIKKNANKFTPSDQRIAEYLVQSYPGTLLLNASEIGKKLEINVSTVTRFFPKIGYKSIKDARTNVRNDVEFIANSPLDRFHQQETHTNSGSQIIKKTLELDLQNIKTTFDDISDQDINRFVDRVIQAESVYVFGGQKPFALAYYLYVQLNLVRKNVHLVQAGNITDCFINFKPKDALILFDFRRYYQGHEKAANFINKNGGQVYIFTDSPLAPSAKYADILFILSTRGISIFDSYTAGLILLNALVAQLIEQTKKVTKKRQGDFEELYKHFGIFSSLKSP